MEDSQTKISTFGEMSKSEFQRFSDFIHHEAGIQLPPHKKTLLEGRLIKRMRALGIGSFSKYAEFIFSPQGQMSELPHMIDAITTNKTEFFREPDHFSYLVDNVLPMLKRDRELGDNGRYYFWSAGCSTGEEPYTLAMVLSEFKNRNPIFDFRILATDICHAVLEKAKNGIYDSAKTAPIPMGMKREYLLRSKNPAKKVVRIAPEIRARVKFAWLNFMDGDFQIQQKVDVIFCRNVIIYFDKKDQEMLLSKFFNQLIPGGFLFLGHSETLTGINLPLNQVFPTVYRKK
ncbi:MAG: protein-glutamate O-methyltransferase [Candidatus Riflebacteria bacterium]|nr:protein-glutamate O-methyltransferase [Candidatus Riflebacteria bacterium]